MRKLLTLLLLASVLLSACGQNAENDPETAYVNITAEEEKLSGKDRQILIYCRSGRRSKLAAECLSALGYSNIKEFGGMIDWPCEVE